MNKVFIVGCPRSGTSLAGRILGACKDTMYWEESSVIFNMVHKGYVEQDEVDCLLKFATIVLNTTARDLPEPPFNLLHTFLLAGITIDPQLEQYRPLRRKDLIWGVLNHFKQKGVKNWIEKTPPHTFEIDQIRANFPGAKILHVFRHPLDVISSIKEWSLRHTQNWEIESSCRLWNENFGYASIKSDLSIKYKDITLHKLIVKQLVDKLELQWTDDCDYLYNKVGSKTVDAWEKRLTRKEIWQAFKFIDWELAERGGFFPY